MQNDIPAQHGAGHNGGPPLDKPTPGFKLTVGEKYLPLFDLTAPRFENYAFYGGRGSAKSTNAAIAIVLWAAQGYERIVCARQYQNSIKESVKSDIEAAIKLLGLEDDFKITEYDIIHKKTRSKFFFVGLELHPESIKSISGITVLWVEEAQTISARSLEILEPTVRSGRARCIWTWNPRYAKDPVDSLFRGNDKDTRDRLKKTGAVFSPPLNSYICYVGVEDNPFFYLTRLPGLKDRALANNSPRYKHVWLGAYDDAAEGRIFTNVRIGRVAVPELCAPRYGLDHGFGSDPFFCVKVYIIEDARVIYIAREATGHGVALRNLPAQILTVVNDKGDYIKADSSQPIVNDHLNSNGFNVDGATKGPGSVKAGITWLQSYAIVIDPECVAMQEEAELYVWQTDKVTKKSLNVPVDAFNHGWDAVRYACEDHILTYNAEDDDEDGGVISLKLRF